LSQKDAAAIPNALYDDINSNKSKSFKKICFLNILLYICRANSIHVEQIIDMRNLIISISILFLLLACKAKSINQKVNKEREGLWIEKYTQDSSQYKSIGKYHKGDPVKRWKYYLNGKIIMREKYKDDYCIRTKYHQNGKIESKGKTRFDNDSKYAHWFYNGDWKFFDERGKAILIKKYENGKLISEIKPQQ
jgi:antitoxin component YwqK of YwqJK toxin-antitoxin module